MNDIFNKALLGESVFKDKNILRFDHIPQNLPFREKQINDIASILSPVLHNSKCSNLLLYGKTGTGKTATVKYILRQFQVTAKTHSKNTAVAYSNARLAGSEYRILVDLAQSINLKIPFTGLPLSEVLNRIFTKISEENLMIIFVIDEIDYLTKHSSDDILYSLTRSGEQLRSGFLSLIGISNDLQFKEFLDPRVLSSLSEEEVVFPPYTVEQLKTILGGRAKEAFYTNKITNAAINLCAALAGTEHGDARRAVDLLRVAGELAERDGTNRVEENHVRLAIKKVDQDRVTEAIRLLPLHEKITLFSISLLNEINSTGEVYSKYTSLCKNVGMEPLTQRRISGLLNELDLLGLISTNIINKGRHGRTKKISSLVPHTTINSIIIEDPTLHNLTK